MIRFLLDVRCLLVVGTAVLLTGCGSPRQNLNLGPESLATPAHRMSRADYPFDASGRYVDAWAAEGTARYGRQVNTDHADEGRSQRRPPDARKPAATKPPAASAKKKPAPSASAKTSRKPSAASPKKPAAKPKSKAKTTHTVKSGDSLSSLSRRYGVPVQAIKRANGLSSDMIRNGRTLVIPK